MVEHHSTGVIRPLAVHEPAFGPRCLIAILRGPVRGSSVVREVSKIIHGGWHTSSLGRGCTAGGRQELGCPGSVVSGSLGERRARKVLEGVALPLKKPGNPRSNFP